MQFILQVLVHKSRARSTEASPEPKMRTLRDGTQINPYSPTQVMCPKHVIVWAEPGHRWLNDYNYFTLPLFFYADWLQEQQGRMGPGPPRRLVELGSEELDLAPHFWTGLLRRRDDAHRGTQIRHGQVREQSFFVVSNLVTFFKIWPQNNLSIYTYCSRCLMLPSLAGFLFGLCGFFVYHYLAPKLYIVPLGSSFCPEDY